MIKECFFFTKIVFFYFLTTRPIPHINSLSKYFLTLSLGLGVVEGALQAKKVPAKRTSALRGVGSHAKPAGKLLQSSACKPQPPISAWQSSLRGVGAHSKPSAKLKSQAAASIKPGAIDRGESASATGGASALTGAMAPSLARPKGAHTAALSLIHI